MSSAPCGMSGPTATTYREIGISSTAARQRDICHETVKAAQTIKADLIVIGSHHPQLKDYLLGPNAAKVVRHPDRSAMVVTE
jgi:nucleotide-binding universal stress UspA family protein